jgi:phospholipid-binding lipoprotein MlaA
MLHNFKKTACSLGCILYLCIFWTPSLFAQDTAAGIGFMADEDADWDDDGDEYTLKVNDPYENWNRKVFNLNHGLYMHAFKPLSKGYDFIVPQRLQSGFSNVFTNIRMPVRFFNSLFQGKYKGAATEFASFMVNTTAGIGGFLNPAKAMHLKSYNEDFGQTLAHHGMNEGPFIIWPLIGPSNGRDTIGTLIDNAFNPLFWFGTLDVAIESDVLRGVRTVKRVNNYSYSIRDNYDALMDGAIDPYIALQNAYINNRNKNIKE